MVVHFAEHGFGKNKFKIHFILTLRSRSKKVCQELEHHETALLQQYIHLKNANMEKKKNY